MKIVRKEILSAEKESTYWDMTIPGNHNYVLGNGNVVHNTGLGFSVERQSIAKLPEVAEEFFDTDSIIKVKDSKMGWAVAFKELITMLWSGQVPKWDLSALRPAGAPLKTFGGRSSGPEPLDRLFKHSVMLFKKSAGRKLTSLECHDLMCFIAEIVVVGGVRRAALISLSNLSDDRMRTAKNGQWWLENGQRALSNNSIAFTEKPEMEAFMKEWLSLYESRSGERGLYNRSAAIKKMKAIGRRDWKKFDDVLGGLNPCVTGDMLVEVFSQGMVFKMTVEDAVSIFERGDHIAIKGLDLETGDIGCYPVSAAAMTRENAKVLKVTDTTSGKFIRVTEDHLVFTKNRGYVAAKDLIAEDVLMVD